MKNKLLATAAALGAVDGVGTYVASKKGEKREAGSDRNSRAGDDKPKRALQLASVASMIDQFTIPNIKILQELGYSVDVVADFTNPGTITAERCEDLKKRLTDMGVRYFDIAIPRETSLLRYV